MASNPQILARLAASGALATLMLLAASAVADSTAKAAADELFRDAVELASRGDFEGAASRFKASYEADPTLGTLLGLAMAEQRCGRLASAYVHYQELLDLSRRFHDNERESEARDRMEALAPDVPRLVIRSAVALPRGARVLLDSSPIPVDALGASIPVDPGAHTVVVRDGERQLFSQALRVAPGERTSVSVSWPSRTAGPAATPSRAAGSAVPSSSAMRNAGMITAGVGLALIAGGGYLWYRSDQTWRELSGQCPGAACSPDSLDRIHEGKNQETWGRIGLIAGGIGLATGATLLLWGKPWTEKRGSGKVAVGPGQVHLRLTF